MEEPKQSPIKERDARVSVSVTFRGVTETTVVDIRDFEDTVVKPLQKPATILAETRNALNAAYGNRVRDVS